MAMEIINEVTNVMQWLPPKESVCQQSFMAVSLSGAGIHFPMTLCDIPQADFHLISAASLIHSSDTT